MGVEEWCLERRDRAVLTYYQLDFKHGYTKSTQNQVGVTDVQKE